MQQTNQPVPYETLLKQYAQENRLDQYRQKHFQQWQSDTAGCSFCVSQGPWPFFGFVPRPYEPVTLCIAVNQNKDFFYLKIPTSNLQSIVKGQKKFRSIPHSQPWQDTLLDMTVAHPLVLQQLPWKLIPGSLEMWEEDNVCILVAQLASPLGKLDTDPEMELERAVFDFMDKSILGFLVREVPFANIGQYRFLWDSQNEEDLLMRMSLLEQDRGLVPRLLVNDL